MVVVGVPDITPLVELRDNPAGSVPEYREYELTIPEIDGEMVNESDLAIVKDEEE